VKKKQKWSVKKSILFEVRRRRTSFIDFSGMNVFLAIFSSALTFWYFCVKTKVHTNGWPGKKINESTGIQQNI
jgi:hypothetical protein